MKSVVKQLLSDAVKYAQKLAETLSKIAKYWPDTKKAIESDQEIAKLWRALGEVMIHSVAPRAAMFSEQKLELCAAESPQVAPTEELLNRIIKHLEYVEYLAEQVRADEVSRDYDRYCELLGELGTRVENMLIRLLPLLPDITRAIIISEVVKKIVDEQPHVHEVYITYISYEDEMFEKPRTAAIMVVREHAEGIVAYGYKTDPAQAQQIAQMLEDVIEQQTKHEAPVIDVE